MLNVIEANIFHDVVLEGHNVWENNRFLIINTEKRHYEVAIMIACTVNADVFWAVD